MTEELFLWQEVGSRLGKTCVFIRRREKLSLGKERRENAGEILNKEEMSSGTQHGICFELFAVLF